jgi:putative glutamine amidotransferase
MRASRAIVGIPVDVKRFGGEESYHAVGEKYIRAVAHVAGVVPVLLPALGSDGDGRNPGESIDINDLLLGLDGLFLTGSRSNIEPHHWGESGVEDNPDPHRDATTLPLIRAAVARDMPIFAVCRGLQELNVALGGTLLRAVHDHPGRMDHREDRSLPRPQRYGPAHAVTLTPDGLLHRLIGEAVVQVNSLHGQGVDSLAPGLVIEARAPDEQVEAVSLPRASFAVGVQWHPEWQAERNPVSRALFGAFGDAVRRYAEAKRG